MKELTLSALMVAAVAFSAAPTRLERVGALGLAAVSLGLAVRQWGAAQGLAVGMVLAMAAASALVLILSPRPRWARPAGLLAGAVGLLLIGASS
jgi:Protein of unknown function (DUF3325)